jgi:hypothetical protein
LAFPDVLDFLRLFLEEISLSSILHFEVVKRTYLFIFGHAFVVGGIIE